MGIFDSFIALFKMAFTNATDATAIMSFTSRKEGEDNLNLYFRSLQRLFIFSLIFFLTSLITGVTLRSHWIVAITGILASLFTLLFAAAISPLVIVIDKALIGSGQKYVKFILYMLFVEILSTLFVMVVPVSNHISLIPILLLLVILAGLLALLGAKPIIKLNTISSLVSIFISVLILSFFFPNTFNALSGKRETVDNFFTDLLNGKFNVIKPVYINNNKLNQNQRKLIKKINIYEDNWSEEIDCSGLRVEYEHPFSGGIQIKYDDGEIQYVKEGEHAILKRPKFKFKGKGYILLYKKNYESTDKKTVELYKNGDPVIILEPGKEQIITVTDEVWSPWIKTGKVAHFNSKPSIPVKVQFSNGEEFIDGPGQHSKFEKPSPIFRYKSLSGTGSVIITGK